VGIGTRNVDNASAWSYYSHFPTIEKEEVMVRRLTVVGFMILSIAMVAPAQDIAKVAPKNVNVRPFGVSGRFGSELLFSSLTPQLAAATRRRATQVSG
jgi:hypothetical protein